jgi:glycosyltransferase involved in cell wall biosynthesis
MRILIASDHYPPLIGGAQIQTRLLARSLAERGHTVAVTTTWQHGLRSFEEDHGIPIYRLRQVASCVPDRFQRPLHHQPPFPDPVTTVMLRRLIKRFKPDVVNSHGWFTYSCAAALLGTDSPLVVSVRDYGFSCATRTMLQMRRVPCSGPAPLKCLRCATDYYGVGKGWLAALAVRAGRPLIRRKTVAVHSVSSYLQEVVRRDVFGKSRNGKENSPAPAVVEEIIHELVEPPPGLDAIGNGSRDRLAQLPSEPFILFVGALRREKGIYELLCAYRRLSSPPPLVLIGTVERETPQAFPEGVIVLTDFPHAAIGHAWERALFGIAPSLLPEPLGTVVCEAMSCGRAVIGTAHGGHPDIITHGVNGLLIPPGDSVALANAMQSLLEDPARRHRLGTAARAVGRRFAAEQAIARFEHLYRAAVAQ